MAGDEFLHPFAHVPPARLGSAGVDDHRQRIDILAVDEDRHLDEIALAVADLVIIEAGVAPADRFQPVVEIEHPRSEEHTSELQSLMRISYAVFCLKKKNQPINTHT